MDKGTLERIINLVVAHGDPADAQALRETVADLQRVIRDNRRLEEALALVHDAVSTDGKAMFKAMLPTTGAEADRHGYGKPLEIARLARERVNGLTHALDDAVTVLRDVAPVSSMAHGDVTEHVANTSAAALK